MNIVFPSPFVFTDFPYSSDGKFLAIFDERAAFSRQSRFQNIFNFGLGLVSKDKSGLDFKLPVR